MSLTREQVEWWLNAPAPHRYTSATAAKCADLARTALHHMDRADAAEAKLEAVVGDIARAAIDTLLHNLDHCGALDSLDLRWNLDGSLRSPQSWVVSVQAAVEEAVEDARAVIERHAGGEK